MPAYKLTFLNSAGEVVGTKIFTATSNFDAMRAAEQIASTAQCAGFELSNKHRTITRRLREPAEQGRRRRL